MENHYKLISREVRELEHTTASFLSEEEHKKYQEFLKQFSGNAYDSLNIPLKGSNVWKVLALNQIGITTTTLQELELALENGMPLKNYYEDGREVVLRSREDNHQPNNYLAQTLADKLGLTSFQHPYIVKGLGIKQSEASKEINPYGLEFVTKNAEVIEAKDFHHKNDVRGFRRINEDYSIEWDENGLRTFYSRDNGLSGVYFGRVLGLVSDNKYLANSSDSGRVVVVS